MPLFTTPPRVAFRRPWPGTHRGLVLWFFSLAYIALGTINYVLTPLPLPTREALAFVLFIAPAPFWGAVMVTAGLISAFCSYCHHDRDTYGYLLLAAFSGCWAGGYVAGWLVFDAPLRSLGGSAIWALFGAVLVAVAGMPNAPLRSRERVGGSL